MGRGSNLDLLEDSDNEEGKDTAEIKVNEDYAKRFSHNKQREALHRLQELKKRGLGGDSGSDGSSSNEEEDEDGLLPEKTEVQFYETLVKVKKKDPSIYEKNVKFYEDDNDLDEEDEKPRRETKEKKAMYLKDVVAQQLLENGPEFEEKSLKKAPKSYVEEQDEFKRAFLLGAQEADNDDDDDDDDGEGGGLLTVKKKTAEELRREKQEEEEAIAEAEKRAKDAEIERRLNDYFGRDDDLDENEKFLKGYLLSKGWIDKEQQKHFSYEDIVGVSDEEEELEAQDKFEAEYNFRFEEGAGDQVLGHARFTDASVRKKPNARKLQRKNKQERLALAEFERKEELKQLKNIKKKEILEKLEKIRNVAGIGSDQDHLLNEEDLDEDFDPVEYDRKMREAFGEEYYGAEDADANFQGYDMDEVEKPDFDAEDELLGLPKGWDGDKSQEGFASVRVKAKELLKSNPHLIGIESEDDLEEDSLEETTIRDSDMSGAENGDIVEDEATEPGETVKNRKRRKGRISLREKLAFDKQLEEYYKLDYEDVIGDLPTRFKYRQVPSNNYGLTVEDILMTDDKELNQYVSIKKLAPYRTKEWEAPKHHRLSQKQRKRVALQNGEFGQSKGMDKFKSKDKGNAKAFVPRSNGQGKSKTEETNGAVDSTTKESKKKRRKRAPSISLSRLIAYGKVPFKRKK